MYFFLTVKYLTQIKGKYQRSLFIQEQVFILFEKLNEIYVFFV